MTLAKNNAFDFFVSFEALEEIQRAEPGSAKSFKPDPLGHIQTAGMRPLGLKIAASQSFKSEAKQFRFLSQVRFC